MWIHVDFWLALWRKRRQMPQAHSHSNLFLLTYVFAINDGVRYKLVACYSSIHTSEGVYNNQANEATVVSKVAGSPI